MKNVLITGAAGFIGSHLVEYAIENGLSVKAFIHYNSRNDWKWLEKSKYLKEIEIVSGDIRDYDSVYKSIKDVQTVFHLAALIGIPYSYISPKAYIDTNIIGTYNVLEAAKERHLEQVLVTSTSETYGTAQYVPIDEKHPILGQSPYSASKIGADQLAISYWRSFNLPVKIVRPFNTYGPRQSARAIIPTVISQIFAGKREIKLGNLTPSRDLTFVRDTCKGFFEIYKSDSLYGEVMNVGMNTEIAIGDLVNLIADLMAESINIVSDNQRKRPLKSEVKRLVCDNHKLLKYTNWKPDYNLKTGLKQTIKWIADNIALYKPELYNV